MNKKNITLFLCLLALAVGGGFLINKWRILGVDCYLDGSLCTPELISYSNQIIGEYWLFNDLSTTLKHQPSYVLEKWQKQWPNKVVVYWVVTPGELTLNTPSKKYLLLSNGKLSENNNIATASLEISDELFSQLFPDLNVNSILTSELLQLSKQLSTWPSETQVTWLEEDKIQITRTSFPPIWIEPTQGAKSSQLVNIIWSNWPPKDMPELPENIVAVDLRFKLPVVKTVFSENQVASPSAATDEEIATQSAVQKVLDFDILRQE